MSKFLPDFNSELRYELLGIVFVTTALISLISLFGLNTGPVGAFINKIIKHVFGVGALIIPIVFLVVGSRYIWTRSKVDYSVKFFGLLLLYFQLLAIWHHYKIPVGQEILPDSLVSGGGLTGGMLLFILRKLFGVDGTVVVILALATSAIIMTGNYSIASGLKLLKERAVDNYEGLRETLVSHYETCASDEPERPPSKSRFYNQEREKVANPNSERDNNGLNEPTVTHASKQVPPRIEIANSAASVPKSLYTIPAISLLKKSSRLRLTKPSKDTIDNAHLLEETLASFSVNAKVINTCQGPSVTRYELEPAAGVKVSKIVNLSDDIALKLASPGVRIEAPIPGKAAVGIEVPNKDVASVPLRDVLESDEFQKAASKLTVGLGKDIAGQSIVADLAKMPHLLVAGATGSGKSVCINTLITSILFKAHPKEVKFVLIDPKMVELSNYNGIPHLLTPVVTDAKKAASALRWAVQEMERRYNLFAAASVRDITRYNEISTDERLPLIVIIIDELADLMMVAPVDVEDAICRLAQMARAAGLHLVLATQRPSVDVITGTIKANVPSRISFAVSSQIDSRTILDMPGAEKLLGKGDMLFYPVGSPKPQRVQGAFITDSEVEELITFIKTQGEPEYSDCVTVASETSAENEPDKIQDELLEEAVRMVLETGQASVSMLQRKFRIGYTRAARLIDTMEEMKIIGPNIGSKARDIIMTSDQVYSRYFKQD